MCHNYLRRKDHSVYFYLNIHKRRQFYRHSLLFCKEKVTDLIFTVNFVPYCVSTSQMIRKDVLVLSKMLFEL